MPGPTVYSGPRVRSWRALWHMLAAYRLPLLIFVSATALIGGYNVFFCRLLRAVWEAQTVNVLPFEAMSHLQAQRYVLGYTATGTFATCALTLGNALVVLMYCSFARVIITCPGYVPAEPWQYTPRFDAERRHQLKVTWSAQLKWIHEQGAAARQRAMQALQEQQALWAYQLHRLQQPPPYAYPPPASGLVTALRSPFPSAVTPGQFPAPNDASRSDSLLMAAPTPQQPVSPPQLAAAGSRAISGTPALTVDGSLFSVDMASIAANPARTAGACSGSAAPQRTCVTSGKAASSAVSPAATEPAVTGVTTTSTTASSSYSTSSSSASGSTTPVASTPDRGSTGALGPHGISTSCDAAPPALSVHRRLCTAIAAAKSTVNPNLVLEYEADGSLRFCGVCHQYKPDGSHHCCVCQRCVFDMDHHCHFLHNCIGRHNYKYFFLCIFYSTLGGAVNSTLFVTVYGFSVVCHDWGHGWWWVPAGMYAISGCIAYLWVQHIFLLIRGVSTLERITELSSENFLMSVSESDHSQVVRPGSCCSDCGMVIGECVHGIAALGERLVELLGCGNKFRRLYKTTASSLTSSGRGDGGEGAPSAPSNRAERRAHRFVVLFGRPRFCLYHLLPLSPPGESSRPRARSHEGEV